MSRVVRVETRIPAGWRANLLARIGLLVVGVWLTISPFALGYRSDDGSVAATVNDTLTGSLVVALALFSLLVPTASAGRPEPPAPR